MFSGKRYSTHSFQSNLGRLHLILLNFERSVKNFTGFFTEDVSKKQQKIG